MTDATTEGQEDVGGTVCTRLAARVDLSRASAASPDGVRPPGVKRFEDLLTLPLSVWIDGTHVRRVTFEEEARTVGIELRDFGVSTDGLDWTRLPDWPAPEEERRADGRLRKALQRARGRSA